MTIFMWMLSILIFILIIPCSGQKAIGLEGRDVFMNWTISSTSLFDFRLVSRDSNNETLITFVSGSTTSNTFGMNYTNRITDVGNVSTGMVSFRLNQLTVQDAGRYSFRYRGSVDIGGQVLVIAVAPSATQVTELTAAVEGVNYSLSCSATSNSKPLDHGLPMKTEWKVNGQSITERERYLVQGRQLTIAGLTALDNGATVTCVAFEDPGAKSDESVWKIDIKYGPINVRFNSSNPTIVREMSQVSINCAADCNPPCTFHWMSGSSVVSTSQTMQIKTASKNDNGSYTCFVSNSVIARNRSMDVTIIVIYGPSSDNMTLSPPDKSLKVEEHTVVAIDCSVDCYPNCKYQWTGPLNYFIQTGALTLRLDKDSGGTYTCKAKNEENQGKTATTTVSVTVYYGPGSSITLGSTPPLHSVDLNQIIDDIVCDASCNPPCNFSWYKANTTHLVSSKILSIGTVKKSDRGNYTCTASNQFLTVQRSSSESFYMIVNCPAITRPSLIVQSMVFGPQYGAEIKSFIVQEGTEVNENQSATFMCSVDSHPKSTITLKRQSNETILKSEVEILQNVYDLQSASCLDMDNYTCSAHNRVGHPVETTIQFFVKCQPRTDFRSPPESITYSKPDGDAILKYSVISYPPPQFTWTFIGNGSEHMNLPASATKYDNGQQSELRFTNLGMNDFGVYRVSAENNIGHPATVDLMLASADVPETPSNVTITDVTHNSLIIQWLSAFNGGREQTFNITTAAHDFTKILYAPDPGYRNFGSSMIKDLAPNTEYSVYVSANNSIGTSNSTVTFTIFTKTEQTSESSTGLLIPGVAGGLGAVCGVILVAVVAVILWRRYQVKKKGFDAEELNREQDDRKRPESGLVENPIYNSLGLESSGLSCPGTEKTAVEKSKKKAVYVEDPAKLYAQIDKTPIKGKKVALKEKHGKTSRGDIYENASLAIKNSAENEYENPGQLAAGPSSGDNAYETPEASASNGQLVNKDGVMYAELKFGPSTMKAGKPVIHGLENRTEYAEIAYGKRGEPLSESDEKDGDGIKKNKEQN